MGGNNFISAGNGDNKVVDISEPAPPAPPAPIPPAPIPPAPPAPIPPAPPTFNLGPKGIGDPLILDTNKDGKVDAKSGIGVDIDNNGVSDGAATGGDKMLAMGDLNGNGIIDGAEVFGDQTISPFTGKALNAANGFDALKMVAEDAQKISALDIYKNGEVNVNLLKTALEKYTGTSLGLISDNNVTSLEKLGDLASINVDDYTQQNVSGDVQGKQSGFYTDTTGNTYKADDIWFTLLNKFQS
jgi:hypothetical protein